MWQGHSSWASQAPLLLISSRVNTLMSAFVQQLNKEMCVSDRHSPAIQCVYCYSQANPSIRAHLKWGYPACIDLNYQSSTCNWSKNLFNIQWGHLLWCHCSDADYIFYYMIADSFSSELMLNVLQFNALIYNPIGHSRDIFMKFPVNSPQVSVTDDLGQSIMAQVIILTIINGSILRFYCLCSLCMLTHHRLWRWLKQLLKPALVWLVHHRMSSSLE